MKNANVFQCTIAVRLKPNVDQNQTDRIFPEASLKDQAIRRQMNFLSNASSFDHPSFSSAVVEAYRVVARTEIRNAPDRDKSTCTGQYLRMGQFISITHRINSAGGFIFLRSPIKSSWIRNMMNLLLYIFRFHNLLYISLIIAIGITLGLTIGISKIW